jgi:hypothetical protein
MMAVRKAMNQESKQIQAEVRREGLRNVIVGQYMFHETRHHPELASEPTEPVPTLPRAHTVADIYKCLHQGEFGVGHSIEDPKKFAHMLGQDLLRAEARSDEPVLENVSLDGRVYRVNLRPYRKIFVRREQSATDLLVEACMKSAVAHRGSRENFMVTLDCFRSLNKNGELAVRGRSYMFPDELVALFLVQVRDFMSASGNIPVLSHSPIYRNYNSPSYRVVDRATLENSDLAFLFQELQ